LDTTFQVDSSQSNSMMMDLEGRKFHNYNPTGTRFECSVQVDIDSSKDYVSFSVEDSIESDMQVNNLDFESISGRFTDDIVHTIPTETREIDIPQGLSSIKIKEANANLTLTNAIGIRGIGDLTVEGRNSKTGASANVPINVTVEAGEPNNPTTSYLPPVNLAPVINIVPDTIILSGEVTLPADVFSVKKASWITGHASVTTPMRLCFIPDTIYFDPDTIKIDEDTRETLSHLRSGKLVVFLENRFPVGFDLDLVVEKPSPDPDTLVKRITINGAPIGVNGIAIRPALDTLHINLSEDELDIFQYSPLITYPILYVPQTDTIAFHINDYLKLGSYVTARIRIGKTGK